MDSISTGRKRLVKVQCSPINPTLVKCCFITVTCMLPIQRGESNQMVSPSSQFLFVANNSLELGHQSSCFLPRVVFVSVTHEKWQMHRRVNVQLYVIQPNPLHPLYGSWWDLSFIIMHECMRFISVSFGTC